MRVRLTDEAAYRLRSIRAYIAEDSPRRADEVIDTITRRAARIGDLPWAGREVPEYRLEAVREVMLAAIPHHLPYST